MHLKQDVIHFNVGTVTMLCILVVGIVPMLCISNIGTIPTFSSSLFYFVMQFIWCVSKLGSDLRPQPKNKLFCVGHSAKSIDPKDNEICS